jgi:hypothetical protein
MSKRVLFRYDYSVSRVITHLLQRTRCLAATTLPARASLNRAEA